MEPSTRRIASNRIAAIMTHCNRYSFQGQARLAKDAGISRSAVSRMLAGRSNPSFALVMAVTQALEEQLGRHIDPRELVSLDGSYPTPFVCDLCGCRGCLPAQVYDDCDAVKPEYRHIRPGRWSLPLSPLSFGKEGLCSE